MHILIAGGGIGGLTAALCLSQADHKVTIFEQSEEFSEVGAGIQCGANAVHVLKSLGLAKSLNKVAVKPKRVDFRDFKSGSKLHSMKLGPSYQKKYGAPYWHLHRADLQQVLVAALKQTSNVEIKMGVRAISASETKDSVAIVLEGSRQYSGDCLLVADGVHSRIRRKLLGRSEAQFTGNVAWRGVVPVDRLPEDWMDTVVSNFVGPKKHMVLYYLRDKKLANFVGVVERAEWHSDSWVMPAPWQELKDDFTGWHPSVQTIIDAMDKDQCYRWGLFDHPPLTKWSTKRTTLLGDAAHAALPFMASGAAMAIEDARIFQRALDSKKSIPEALKCYENNRLSRTTRIQNDSVKAGKLYHFKSSFMRKLAFMALKLVLFRKESFLPKYNANKIKLR